MRILGNGFIIRDVETCMNKDKKNEMIMKVNFIEFCNNQIKFITIMFLPEFTSYVLHITLWFLSYPLDFAHTVDSVIAINARWEWTIHWNVHSKKCGTQKIAKCRDCFNVKISHLVL